LTVVQEGGLDKSLGTLTASEISCFLKVRDGIPFTSRAIAKSGMLQLIMASMVTYSVTITTIKLSLLILLRRIFNISKFRIWSTVMESLCVVWLWSAIFTNVLQCVPINAVFKQELLDPENCLPKQAWYWGLTITNLVLDVVILVLSMLMVIDLSFPFAQKYLLYGLFGLGGM
jgi:hypothetical protein